MDTKYDPPLDAGIKNQVLFLNANGVETYESCQGGEGHAYHEPTVRFHGEQSHGMYVASLCVKGGFKVSELRRVWSFSWDREFNGPYWEITFQQPSPDSP